ncbi:enkurin-like [Antennarius striatus]|uniref:enkurin-like n=1 Tax=Antennarius striatus TaxID=241820 RepID=UPI0035B3D583
MGPIAVEKPLPSNYLKKHTRENKLLLRIPASTEPRNHVLTKPPVPRRNELAPVRLHIVADFVKNNREKVVAGAKKTSEATDQDYRKVKGYGEIPQYLQKLKNELSQQKAKPMKEDQYLPESRQKEILKELSKKWVKLQAEAKKIPCLGDKTKQIFQEKFNEATRNLESDIKLFETGKKLFIPSLLKNTYYAHEYITGKKSTKPLVPSI